jgi:hypothetical protein
MSYSDFDGDGELMRFIYYSHVEPRVTRADIKQILATSQRNNAAAAITGALCFDNRRFFQVLEGRRLALNTAFARILRDPRHSLVNLMVAEPIRAPAFSNWSMAFVGGDRLSETMFKAFCGDSVFRPDRMTSNRARAFALEFLADICRQSQAP